MDRDQLLEREPYKRYVAYMQERAGVYPQRAYMPHCDDLVLHAPGRCVYCDKYSDLQAYRIAKSIAFTGDLNSRADYSDPASLLRAVDQIELWHGNVPMTPAQARARDGWWDKYLRQLDNIILGGEDDKPDGRDDD